MTTCDAEYAGLITHSTCNAQCERVRAYVAHVVDAVFMAGLAAHRALVTADGAGTPAQSDMTRAAMYTNLALFKCATADGSTCDDGDAGQAGTTPGDYSANARYVSGFTTTKLGFTKKANGVPAYHIMNMGSNGHWTCAGTWVPGSGGLRTDQGSTSTTNPSGSICGNNAGYAGTSTSVTAARANPVVYNVPTPANTAAAGGVCSMPQASAAVYSASTALLLAVLAYIL